MVEVEKIEEKVEEKVSEDVKIEPARGRTRERTFRELED